MNLLREIRKQPEQIRGVFTWLCVVIVFSFTVFVWFRSTQQRLVALLHPERLENQPAILAEGGKKALSPFAGLANSFSLLRSSFSEILTGQEAVNFTAQESSGITAEPAEREVKPGLLPVTREKE